MKGKLIVIEGTDCSGKETQTNMLFNRMQQDNIDIFKYYYPHYEDPTGKIIGGPYLGKEHIGRGFFEEGAASVDPKVSALYYAADFKYSSPMIIDKLNKGTNVILDRYIFSTFAHQGGKISNKEKRLQNYQWLDNLFFKFLELKKPDLVILLYMPFEYAEILKKNRVERPDQNESSKQHLIDAERAYLELAEIYNFKIINCVEKKVLKTIDQINNEVYEIVKESF